MIVRVTAVFALLALAAVPAARADAVVVARNHVKIDPSADWSFTQAKLPEKGTKPEGPIASAVHRSGAARAALVRINYPNTPAWRKQKHYFTDVLRGLEEATPGFTLESKRQMRLDRVPILDVRYRRKHDTRPHVVTRFLFFRTFTLIISVTSDRAHRRAARGLARSLVPHLK